MRRDSSERSLAQLVLQRNIVLRVMWRESRLGVLVVLSNGKVGLFHEAAQLRISTLDS
jgi:hypothetical protein